MQIMKKRKPKVEIKRVENVEANCHVLDLSEINTDDYYPLPAFVSTNESSLQDMLDLWNSTEPPLADK